MLCIGTRIVSAKRSLPATNIHSVTTIEWALVMRKGWRWVSGWMVGWLVGAAAAGERA